MRDLTFPERHFIGNCLEILGIQHLYTFNEWHGNTEEVVTVIENSETRQNIKTAVLSRIRNVTNSPSEINTNILCEWFWNLIDLLLNP